MFFNMFFFITNKLNMRASMNRLIFGFVEFLQIKRNTIRLTKKRNTIPSFFFSFLVLNIFIINPKKEP